MERSRSVTELAVDVARQASLLLRTEASLARAEMSENLSAIASGIGLMIAGATLLIPALVLILQAAAAAVTAAGLANYWSLAIFGGGSFLLGVILALIGRSRTKLSNLRMSKTLEDLDRDAAMAKQKIGLKDDKTQRAA
jgi:hypothetical protein